MPGVPDPLYVQPEPLYVQPEPHCATPPRPSPNFGEESGSRFWDDIRRYGFGPSSVGAWYFRTLRSLPIGARVFVFIPGGGIGYVSVGTRYRRGQALRPGARRLSR
jgi:hypothetical protein